VSAAGPRGVPLRRRLFLLVAAGVLPLAAMAALGLHALWDQQRSQAHRAALEIARAMSTAVDGELRRSIAAIEALTASPLLGRGDIAAFHAMMQASLARRPDWVTLLLAAPDGVTLANARVPFGTPLQPIVEPDSLGRAVASGQPSIGPLAQGTQVAAIPVRVPVRTGDGIRYILTAAVKADGMREILDRQRIPDDWVVAIFDGSEQLVARSRQRDVTLGQRPSPTLRALMAEKGDEGTGLTNTLEGDAVYTAFSRSRETRWTVAVGIPEAIVEDAARRSAAAYAAGLALSLALAIGAALVVARSVNEPMRVLARAAKELGEGQAPNVPLTPVNEIREVGDALVAAAHERAASEAERAALLERESAARAAAESANRAKDEFLAMLGHELRNPLSAISNAAQILARRECTLRQREFATGVVTRQTQNLVRMVDDLLDAGRLVAGKVGLARGVVELDRLAHDVCDQMREAGRFARHDVRVSTEPVVVDGDRTRLEQVLNNLLANALTHTPPGGTIAVDVRVVDGRGQLDVADSGVGIPDEDLPHVFDLFFQGEQSADRPNSGLGIGLTLVKHLVELHGGTIDVESGSERRGTRFRVALPLHGAPAPVIARPAPAPARAVTVLVVEDNEDARTTLRVALELAGHRVIEAADGAEALRALDGVRVDVALVDVGLPGIDGYALCRRLREREDTRDLPIVALTGYGQRDDVARAEAAGFDLHVTKPASEQQLAEALAIAATRRNARTA
jgi:signal transduction histidine kinase/ActR/RegA family two-component response regulator